MQDRPQHTLATQQLMSISIISFAASSSEDTVRRAFNQFILEQEFFFRMEKIIWGVVLSTGRVSALADKY